jgi:hypothetical protein
MSEYRIYPDDPTTAEEVVQDTFEHIDDGISGMDFLRRVENNGECLRDVNEQRRVRLYVNGVRTHLRGVFVEEKNDDGVAGYYDGSSITVTENTLGIHKSIEETIAHTKEVEEHERYHKKGNHLAALRPGGSANGETILRMGGIDFTQRGLIEGLTVDRTGQQFVSGEYVQFAEDLRQGMRNAGISIHEVETAVNIRKDLTKIDDANRRKVAA